MFQSIEDDTNTINIQELQKLNMVASHPMYFLHAKLVAYSLKKIKKKLN